MHQCTQKERDIETGLDYFNARYKQPYSRRRHTFIYVRNDATGESAYFDYYVEDGVTKLGQLHLGGSTGAAFLRSVRSHQIFHRNIQGLGQAEKLLRAQCDRVELPLSVGWLGETESFGKLLLGEDPPALGACEDAGRKECALQAPVPTACLIRFVRP